MADTTLLENATNNNQQVQQNINQANANQTNAVQPITIPVQIQPVVASNNEINNQSTLNNVQNVSTVDNTQQNVSAPVEYKNNTPAVTNTVQNNVNKSTNYSGYTIKQVDTSNIDTTTVNGQYKSAYGDAVNQILLELYNNRYFDYNPQEDEALQQAVDYSTKTTTSSLASRGILNSTITAERISRVVSELTAEYRQLALSEWQTQMNMISNIAQLYMSMDEYQFQKWQDARDQAWKEKLQKYQEKQDEIQNAWNKVDALGYVDNEASTILGVAVGTLSKDAREAKEAYERELEMMVKKAEIEYETEKKLAEVKTELEKELITYESNASGNTTSKVNLSTYDDIIQNRWAEYDEFTKKYSVSTENNKQIYNYLMAEYNAGRLSSNDAASLIAKYNITNPEDEAKKQRLEYLKQLSEIN